MYCPPFTVVYLPRTYEEADGHDGTIKMTRNIQCRPNMDISWTADCVVVTEIVTTKIWLWATRMM